MRHRDQPFTTTAHQNIYSRLAERKGRGWEKRAPHYSGLAALVTLIFSHPWHGQKVTFNEVPFRV